MVIEIKDVAIYYDKAVALENINMYVKRKEIVAVVGANGAGKTTLLRGLTGLKKIEKGEIRFLGSRIDTLNYYEIFRKGIVHCLEGGRVFPEMSVIDNLLCGGATYKMKNNLESLEYVYELFPVLHDRAKQDAGTLSGGERQMLSLGRCLMSKPSLLLLDEPSFGLAPLAKQNIYDALGKISREQGITILLVEQDAAIALRLADRAYALENGRVAMEGNHDSLLKDSEFKKIYLGL